MPRPPSHKTTLGTLRAALQKADSSITAAKLAEQIGVSLSLIKQVEAGHKPMTHSLARRIAFHYSVPLDWLTDGAPGGGVPGLQAGTTYDAKKALAFAQAWDGRPWIEFSEDIREIAQEVARTIAQRQANQVGAMLSKSLEFQDRRFLGVTRILQEALEKIAAEYFPDDGKGPKVKQGGPPSGRRARAARASRSAK